MVLTTLRTITSLFISVGRMFVRPILQVAKLKHYAGHFAPKEDGIGVKSSKLSFLVRATVSQFNRIKP